MSESKTYVLDPDHICIVKRDPEKGYLFDCWVGGKKPDGVNPEDVSTLISRLAEGDWKNASVCVRYPADTPLWIVHVTREEIHQKEKRPEFQFVLRWSSLSKVVGDKEDKEDKEDKKDSIFLKVLLSITLIIVGGVMGALCYQYWEKQQTQESVQEPEVATKMTPATKELLRKWKDAENFLSIFEREDVVEYRRNKTSNKEYGKIFFFETRLPDNPEQRFTFAEYDKIREFLEAMKDFVYEKQSN